MIQGGNATPAYGAFTPAYGGHTPAHGQHTPSHTGQQTPGWDGACAESVIAAVCSDACCGHVHAGGRTPQVYASYRPYVYCVFFHFVNQLILL